MKKYSIIVLIFFYFFAGLNHFITPDFYLPLIPDYFPFPEYINYIVGALEILFAMLLIYPKGRRIAVYSIVLLLFAFIPSHIYFISKGNCFEGYFCIPSFISWLRLLIIHPILILWAWSYRNNTTTIYSN